VIIKGIFLGLLAQITFALGFILIAQATTPKNQLLRTSLIISFAGMIAIAVIVYYITEFVSLVYFNKKDLVYLAIGAILVLMLGEGLYIKGIYDSDVTTVSYTALAYPAIVLIIESIMGRHKLTIQDLLGFIVLAIGFIIIVSKR